MWLNLRWTTILHLMGVLISETVVGESPFQNRGQLQTSRAFNAAKKFFNDTSITVQDTDKLKFWPQGGALTTADPCPTIGSTPNDMFDIKDGAAYQTVAIHYFYTHPDNPNSQNTAHTVISDLAEARKCDGTKVICFEEGTTETDEAEPNRKLCLMDKGAVKKGQECIHHYECEIGTLCIFSHKQSGKYGDIEDLRRFCSGTFKMIPSLILISIFAALTIAVFRIGN